MRDLVHRERQPVLDLCCERAIGTLPDKVAKEYLARLVFQPVRWLLLPLPVPLLRGRRQEGEPGPTKHWLALQFGPA